MANRDQIVGKPGDEKVPIIIKNRKIRDKSPADCDSAERIEFVRSSRAARLPQISSRRRLANAVGLPATKESARGGRKIPQSKMSGASRNGIDTKERSGLPEPAPCGCRSQRCPTAGRVLSP